MQSTLHAMVICMCSMLMLLCPPQVASHVPSMQPGFQANQGQHDPRVQFWAQRSGIALFVTEQAELVHVLKGSGDRDWVLVERFDGAQANAITAVGRENFAIGQLRGISEQVEPLASYRQLDLGEVWPGIRADVRLAAGGFEKRFHLDPGTDAEAIVLRLDGVKSLRIADDGRLLLETGLGVATLDRPIAWQVIHGKRRAVDIRYALAGNLSYGFHLGPFDDRYALTIDPIIRSTFVGGNSEESLTDMVVADDSVYVAGYTLSANFPGTNGGFQPTIQRNSALGGNPFVARYSLDLSTLLQATYFGVFGPIDGGQSGGPTPRGLAVSADSVYLVGQTFSVVGQIPGASNGAQPTPGGNSDGFVVRFNRTLTAVSQSTFYGGTNSDALWTAAVGPDGLYAVGSSASSSLPGGSAGAITSLPSGGDAIVVKFALDLRSIANASFVSGSGTGAGKEARAVTVDGDDVYVAGSSGTGLVATAGAFQPNLASTGVGMDGFVARFNAGLTTIRRSSYLGGSQDEIVRDIAIDANNVYLAGDTRSSNFPIAPNAPDTQFSQGEGFVLALSRDLSTRSGGTFVGGSNSNDNLWSLAMADGALFVGGSTNSSSFPGTENGATSGNPNNQIVGFVTRLNTALSQIQQSTYYGVGSGLVQVFGFGYGADSVYLSGRVQGSTLPESSGGAQPNSGGTFDAFIGRISPDLGMPQPSANLAISKTGSIDIIENEYMTYQVRLQNLGPDPAVNAEVADILPADLIDARWVCTATGGGTCPAASGSGNLQATVTLPVGAVLTFDFCARYVGIGTALSNTATATVAANMLDPVSANNTATASLNDPSLFKDGFEDSNIPPLCQTLP